ncbi:MAG: hypothetical protein WD315_01370 [Balneolaceae bacterium]
MSWTRRFLITGVLFLLSTPLSAQMANNPWTQSYQAVLFGDQQVSHDPVTLVMPGVAQMSGFSSYLENPASAALVEQSFGSFGIAYRSVSQSTAFLNQSHNLGDNQTGVSNIGFAYRFPTVQGRMVWGAGYSQHSYYNRAMGIGGFNSGSSITDFFKIPNSEYADVAFDAYAIDYGDEFENWDESILRVGFENYGEYLGIDQEGEIYQRGMAGDYSTFLATEFQENLMVGVSIGLRSGRYRYSRTFLEVDREGQYNGLIADSDGDDEPDTDIDSILLNDEVQSEFVSFALRAGAIYQISDRVSIGASYTFPSRLSVEEELDGRIISTMDNLVEFEEELRTSFSYTVHSPGRVHLGVALNPLEKVSLSLSGEYVDHSGTDVGFDAELFEQERNENRFISDHYRAVWNFRGGVAVDLADDITLRGGYGVRPSRFATGGVREDQFSLGLGMTVSDAARLEIGAQYSRWRDEFSVVYSYTDYDYSTLPDEPPVPRTRDEFANQDGNRIQVLATFQLFFN